jgi:hypothetical protein
MQKVKTLKCDEGIEYRISNKEFRISKLETSKYLRGESHPLPGGAHKDFTNFKSRGGSC